MRLGILVWGGNVRNLSLFCIMSFRPTQKHRDRFGRREGLFLMRQNVAECLSLERSEGERGVGVVVV